MLSTLKRATVLGGGSWGTALAHLLGTHGYETLLWLRDDKVAKEINSRHTNKKYLKGYSIHEGVEATTDLARAATHAPAIIVAIPSKALRKVAYELGEHVTGEQILISATKGLDAQTFTRMSEILREETCALKIGSLSGPNLAAEVMAGHPSATVVASPFEEVIEVAEHLLAGQRFRLYGNFDLLGVEIAGAMKNIYAIAAGICAGLGFGANTLSLLMTRGLAEIQRMGAAFGADPATFMGLAGVGDLIATCTSTLSRNHTVGRRLAGGESLEEIQGDMVMVAEGVNTTAAVHRYATRHDVYMPIAEGMYQILYQRAPIPEVIEQLMLNTSLYEISDAPIHVDTNTTPSITEHAASLAARAKPVA